MRIVRKTKYFFRFKYRKGHNIHSPFVYNLVREVFMPKPSVSLGVDCDMLNKLCSYNIKSRHAERWCHLYGYLEKDSYVINPVNYNDEDVVFITSIHSVDTVEAILESMNSKSNRVVAVIYGINKNRECREWWEKMDNSVVLDFNSFGVIIYDNLLSPKKYKLKY